MTSTFPRWREDQDPPFVYELSRRLANHLEVDVLAPHAHGAAVFEELDGIRVHRFRYWVEKWQKLAYGGGMLANLHRCPWCYLLIPPFLIAAWLRLIQLHRTNNYGLVHAHWLVPQGLMAALASLFLRPGSFRLLCTAHGADLFALRGRFWRWVQRCVAERADGITVVSHAMRDPLLSLGRFESKVRVIPMGVDLQERFVPPVGERRRGSILFVGRLVEKKGLRYLIEALPGILARHPQAHLTIAGTGPERARILQYLDELQLHSHVHLPGALPNRDLAALYQASEVVVFPSIVAEDGDQEGFGLVLVEAMGCECAVVATDLAAMGDIVSDGETGLVVRQKDPEHLADRINALLDQPEICRTLGRAGRNFVLARYDWETIAAQYRQFIALLVDHEE
jgi:glycosyltransferase involved in cell wall biosynthesis